MPPLQPLLLRPIRLLLRLVLARQTTSPVANPLPVAASTAAKTSTSARLFSSTAAAADFDPDTVASSFKEWFGRPTTVFDQIYDALTSALASAPDDRALHSSLSSLRLRLDEQFVLRVLRHQPRCHIPLGVDRDDNGGSGGSRFTNNVLLMRIKFFEWAGRQPRYRHTRAAYHTMFKILCHARLMSVVVDWLVFEEALWRQPLAPYGRISFYKTIVIGYAVAGRSDIALQMFGRMRFQGIDLDSFSYHILLNALVEESSFDIARSILTQITDRGHANIITTIIQVKSLCKQGKVDEARKVLFEEVDEAVRSTVGADRAVGTLVEALCGLRRFDEAGHLVEEFGGSRSYSIWIKNLISTCRVDGAIQFLHTKRLSEGYVPEVLSYNRLICQLLSEDRLEEVNDVIMEMRDDGIVPDRVTMSAVLCFFCKAGMIDVALQLYASRHAFGLTPNSLAFNHLINALCEDGNIDEACLVLEESMRHGYFPGKQTFRFLADFLCRMGKLDKMGKLLDVAMQRNTVPISFACARYVSALCKAGRMEEAYLVASQKSTGASIPLSMHAYVSLIYGFISLRRGDMICRLLIEMQDNGHIPSMKLYRDSICCLCETGDLNRVFGLLFTQLSRRELDRRTCYNYFINGLGHAKQPESAREVFEMMRKEGIEPNSDSQILMLQSFMKSQRVSDTLNFFNEINAEHEPSNKMYNVLIVGLCKAGKPEPGKRIVGKPEPAIFFWDEVRKKGIIPSLQCYEELVSVLCSCRYYQMAVKVVKDFEQTGRPPSPFLCNVLLSHTLKTQELRQAWSRLDNDNSENEQVDLQPGQRLLGELIAAFSGGIRRAKNLDIVDEVIEKSFPVNLFTYNVLLKGLAMLGKMDYACSLFDRICKKGYIPNKWTYDIIVYGFCMNNRKKDAEIWMEKMFQHRFLPTWKTMDLFYRTPTC